jgi:hypothetical protein
VQEEELVNARYGYAYRRGRIRGHGALGLDPLRDSSFIRVLLFLSHNEIESAFFPGLIR